MRGVRVIPNAYYATVGGPRWVVTLRRGEGRGRATEVGVCPPLIFVDGQYLGNTELIMIDDVVPVVNLEAIEAHGSIATMPNTFNRQGSRCGVIAFWTR